MKTSASARHKRLPWLLRRHQPLLRHRNPRRCRRSSLFEVVLPGFYAIVASMSNLEIPLGAPFAGSVDPCFTQLADLLARLAAYKPSVSAPVQRIGTVGDTV